MSKKAGKEITSLDDFFTTKKEALGIGLSIVYGIIKAHHGAIYVNSTIGVGTKFSIYLPAVESEARQPVSKGINFTKIKSKFSKTVLIVDDEGLIRELTEAVLTSAKTGNWVEIK